MHDRARMLAEIDDAREGFDVVVIGGGANGVGIALDAASRGLKVALFERGDFASGTSSRSSKLIHGGVRYLGLGQWGLVRQALRERSILLANAPALVTPLRFVIPAYSSFDRLKFTLGLKCYDWLAGSHRLRASTAMNCTAVHATLPHLATRGLRGAVAYDDALFDDARLVIAILGAACAHGAVALNYAEVVDIHHSGGRICGVGVNDRLGGAALNVRARVVINAGGPWGDEVRRLDDSAARTALTTSQGAHVVVPARFLGSDQALVLPRTMDGRIMFAIPWHGQVLLGTTDTALATTPRAPHPLAEEIDQILEVAADFLDPAPTRADITSTFAGLRPLAGVPDGAATARRSREHALDVSAGGLVSVSGGKWTTYRLIAEQTVDLAIRTAALRAPASATAQLALAPHALARDPRFEPWGNAASRLAALVSADPRLGEPLHPELPYCGAHVLWAVREELAQSAADVLAYRTRALFINARAAADIAPAVAALMAAELGQDAAWIAQQTADAVKAAQAFSLTPIPTRDTHD